MPVFNPELLAADCDGRWTSLPLAPLTGFSIDSRNLAPGDVFVALRTGKRDGHEFVGTAADVGAAAAIVSTPRADVLLPQLVVADTLAAFQAMAEAHRRRFKGRVVGVTGSAGKTSTKDILSLILGGGGEVLGTEGNLNNHLGVPLTLLRLENDVHKFAVVEAGISGPGEMDVVASLIQPDVAIVTIVAAAHLDRLGSVAGVSEEKARLVGHLRHGGVAVFPIECLEYTAFHDLAGPAYVTMHAGATVTDVPAGVHLVPVAVSHRDDATDLCITWRGSLEEFTMRRTTAGMAGNAAIAIVSALHLGAASREIRERLPRWKPSKLRGNIVSLGNRPVYVDCYNANPASMVDALEGFLAIVPGAHPRLYVVGCMEELGTDAEQLHRSTGYVWPLREQDQLIVFGAHATALADGAREAAPDATILINPDRDEVRGIIDAFPGPVFMKGSRRHRLEALIDAGAASARETGETAA